MKATKQLLTESRVVMDVEPCVEGVQGIGKGDTIGGYGRALALCLSSEKLDFMESLFSVHASKFPLYFILVPKFSFL